jgi:tRNA A37 threonylcarbamoyladenosine dehydratase
MLDRYKRSFDTVTEQELEKIRSKTVGVVGAGGLGGYVIEMMCFDLWNNHHFVVDLDD